MSTESDPLAMPPPLGQRSLWSDLGDDACSFLQNHPWHDDPIENDFGAVLATGKLVLQAANNSPVTFKKFADSLDVHSNHHFKSRKVATDLAFVSLETIKIFMRTPFLEYTPPSILPRGT